jgi:urease accessory protein
MLVFGRAARGERFSAGLLHESWRVRVGGRLAWADTLRLEGEIAERIDAPFGFAGAGALATAVYVGADAAAHLPRMRGIAEAAGGGATLVNGVLLARFLGPRSDSVRQALTGYLCDLRQAAGDLPARLPRLWHS